MDDKLLARPIPSAQHLENGFPKYHLPRISVNDFHWPQFLGPKPCCSLGDLLRLTLHYKAIATETNVTSYDLFPKPFIYGEVSFPSEKKSEEAQPLRWTAEMADQG